MRQSSGYAIQKDLRDILGSKGHLLTEVQPVNSGFAIRLASPEALDTLTDSLPLISSHFQEAVVERASNYTSYRISSVPRSLATVGLEGLSYLNTTPSTLTSELS